MKKLPHRVGSLLYVEVALITSDSEQNAVLGLDEPEEIKYARGILDLELFECAWENAEGYVNATFGGDPAAMKITYEKFSELLEGYRAEQFFKNQTN